MLNDYGYCCKNHIAAGILAVGGDVMMVAADYSGMSIEELVDAEGYCV